MAQIVLDSEDKIEVAEGLKLLVGDLAAGAVHAVVVLHHILSRDDSIRPPCTAPLLSQAPHHTRIAKARVPAACIECQWWHAHTEILEVLKPCGIGHRGQPRRGICRGGP